MNGHQVKELKILDMMLSRAKKRHLYLKTLYEKSGGRDGVNCDMWSIGDELGLTHDETSQIFEYLKSEGFVLIAAGGKPSQIWLTHEGVKEAERLESQT
jgi:predicted transcriptional regulator